VTVRAPDLDAFITRYCRHVSGDRIFIFSKTPQPVGTRVRFTLQLANGEPLIHGKGTVLRQQLDAGDARHPAGMELEFVPLDERSQTLIDFMGATRAGLADEVAPIVRAVVPPKPPPPKPASKPKRATVPVARPPSQSLEVGWAKVMDPTPPPEPAATGEPSLTAGPAPALAEAWRAPALSGELPANPFSEVSDGAIEYFVEWSLEQSIGQRSEQSARFSDVDMSLPGKTGPQAAQNPSSRPRSLRLAASCFVAGVLVGATAVALVRRKPAHPTAAIAAVAAPPPPVALAAAPVAPPAAATQPPSPPPPPPTPPAAAADATLAIASKPVGATVTIDGAPAGQTPLTTQVSAGRHEVVVTKERYATTTMTSNAPGQLRVELRRPPALLHVTSTPAAATVSIEGQERGRTPLDVKLPAFESYDVRVTLLGQKPWRKTVYLRGPNSHVDAALVATKPTSSRAGRR
jgi:hypothetical protein